MDTGKAEIWLRTHGISACPVCGQRSFSIHDMVSMTNTLQDGGHIDYLSGLPLTVVICNNCAYLMFFSAKLMGVV